MFFVNNLYQVFLTMAVLAVIVFSLFSKLEKTKFLAVQQKKIRSEEKYERKQRACVRQKA